MNTLYITTPSFAPPDANGPAGFTTKWHGHGSNHQGNNNPGDTAADRHNFGDATAGKSGVNPTQGSAQDDFLAETGLPMIHADHGAQHNDADDAEDDLLDLLL